jgi:large subunit ribosomal protein L19
MNKSPVVVELEKRQLKESVGEFSIGDTVSVHQKIIEGNKERVQIFTGTVISRKGRGLAETFTVHRIAYGEGMERVFMLHSPRIQRIEVTRRGKVRSSKLYRLRGTSGKASRVKEHLGVRPVKGAKAAAAKAQESAE